MIPLLTDILATIGGCTVLFVAWAVLVIPLLVFNYSAHRLEREAHEKFNAFLDAWDIEREVHCQN